MDGRKAELPADEEGRQYHIGAGPGDLARHILLVGDPDRADRAGDLLGVLDP
jgi:uridine phosphorylase